MYWAAHDKNIFTIDACEDDAQYAASCPGWAGVGECSKNPDFMLVYCKKSCNACEGKFSVYYRACAIITCSWLKCSWILNILYICSGL